MASGGTQLTLFRIAWLQLAFNPIPILGFAAALFRLAAQVPDEVFAYESFAGVKGAGGFSLVLTGMIVALFGGVTAVFSYAYVMALAPEGTAKFDKRDDERDAMAEIIASRKS
jgi:hypothetical protein